MFSASSFGFFGGFTGSPLSASFFPPSTGVSHVPLAHVAGFTSSSIARRLPETPIFPRVHLSPERSVLQAAAISAFVGSESSRKHPFLRRIALSSDHRDIVSDIYLEVIGDYLFYFYYA